MDKVGKVEWVQRRLQCNEPVVPLSAAQTGRRDNSGGELVGMGGAGGVTFT